MLFSANTAVSVTNVTDSASNTYTQAYLRANGTSIELGCYYLLNCGTGITSVTANFGASTDIGMWVWEFSGLATSSALDGTPVSASGSSTAPASGNLTTTNANDLLIGGIVWPSHSTTLSGTTTGFTQETKQNGGNNSELQAAYQIVSATGSYSFSGTLSASKPWAAGIAAFKAAASGTQYNQSLTGTFVSIGSNPSKAIDYLATGTFLSSGVVPTKAVQKGIAGNFASTGTVVKAIVKNGITGSLLVAGVLARRTGKVLNGIVVAVGSSPVKAIIHTATGGLVMAGTVPIKTISKGVSGAFAASGAVTKAIAKAIVAGTFKVSGVLATAKFKLVTLTGNFVSSGAVTKSVAHGLSGRLITSGTVSRALSKVLTSASLSTAGTFTKQAQKVLAGTIQESGIITREIGKTFSGALVASGVMARVIGKSLAGIALASGTLSRGIAKSVSGSLVSGGTITRSIAKTLTSASLVASGSIARQINKGLTAAVVYIGSLSTSFSGGANHYTVNLTGSFVPSGTMTGREIAKTMSANVVLSGILAKSVGKLLVVAVLSATGSIGKSIGKLVGGSGVFAGTVSKAIKVNKSAAFVTSGNLVTAAQHFLAFASSLVTSGALQRSTLKAFSGATVMAGSIKRGIAKGLGSNLALAGSIGKGIRKGIAGVFSYFGSLFSQKPSQSAIVLVVPVRSFEVTAGARSFSVAVQTRNLSTTAGVRSLVVNAPARYTAVEVV